MWKLIGFGSNYFQNNELYQKAVVNDQNLSIVVFKGMHFKYHD